MIKSQKVGNRKLPSFLRMPESSYFNMFWMPDQVRHDESVTFCETVKIDYHIFEGLKTRRSVTGVMACRRQCKHSETANGRTRFFA
ncbi:hypothetical protein DSCW_29360 [Desulfosarcina widdelii]|uniref:Uncharacterized protein n=1 Tax=Desulfosarcina widdelii TaxID=947919 RepID=A0A5K7Z5M4_9BACT|nr:hypothetical protein DSCW_29360 [Desulfosarcina widdelii]